MARSAPRDRIGVRSLALLARAYPKDFRREFIEPMLQAARDGLEDAAAGAAGSAFAFWRRAAGDILVGGARMRLRRRLGRPDPPLQRPPRRRGPIGWMQRQADVFALDVASGVRSLAKSPWLTTAAVGTLAATIGLTTLTFSVVYGITLREPPYPGADRLVDLRLEGHDERGRRGSMSFPLDALGDVPGSFVGLAEFHESQVMIGNDESNRMVTAAEVTPGLMGLLGVTPALGRAFNDDDADPGAPPAVILGYELWRADFAADPDVLGRSLDVNNVPRTIVGIMPEGFSFSYYARLWIPLGPERELRGYPIDGGVVGRLRDGVALEQAGEELEIRRQQLAAAEVRPFDDVTTSRDRGWRFRMDVRPLGWERWYELGWLPFIALLPVVFVLMVACANVAGLLLSRSLRRRREMILRTVIGGDRGRLMRQLLTESTLLAAGAGGLGLLGATWSGNLLKETADHAFQKAFPYGFGSMGIQFAVPGWLRLEPDAVVMSVAVAASLVAVAAIGLVPARLAVQQDLGAALRTGGDGATAGRGVRRWQGLLLVVQIALSVLLVGVASVTLRGTMTLASFDTGIDAERVLELQFGRAQSAADADDVALARVNLTAIERYGSLPGVESVSSLWEAANDDVQRRTTLMGNSFVEVVAPPALAERRGVFGRVVGPDYFRTLGLRILRGRGIDARDTNASQRVAVVSESVSRAGWPDGEALGEEIVLVDGGPGYAIIGIVEDQRRSESLHSPRIPDAWYHVYVPATQIGTVPRHLLARAAGEPGQLVGPLRRIAHAIDPAVPLTIRRPDERAFESTLLPLLRWLTRALATIGIGALALSAVGIFSVVAFSVAQRTREIGLRTALGATQASIVSLVLRRSVRLALAGIVLGVLGAAAFGRVLGSMLFGVSPFDLASLIAVAAAVTIVTLVAAWQPARRAAHADPAAALREE